MEKLPGAGSNRVYYRITDGSGRSVIGVVGTSSDENHAFVYLANHFTKQQLPVPQVLAVADDELRYLQTDLGGTSLFDALREGREKGGQYNEQEKELLRITIRELPRIQILGAHGLDWINCYPQPEFDIDSVMFDLNYFKYCFLKATGLDFHELKLEVDFRMLAKDLLAEKQQAFLYRDFQARNVMLCQQPYFIDFQGGRKGPVYYDLASFLWQASAKYPAELRKELVKEYYEELKKYTEVPTEHHFNRRLQLFVLFRTLQVLGAYGFRGYFERKKHFIDSIPPAIENLRELLELNQQESSLFPYPYLIGILQQLTERIHTSSTSTLSRKEEAGGDSPLVVRVFSFSYKRAIPEDESGNGGGYVFDCRSTHNPGRYEPYKKLTGLDEPVIRFLEDDGEILTFLESVYKLADHHVERYMQRGFTSLMFSFGCTGGQHRSVYSAQHLAEHIHEKYGIEVRLCHREQGITQTLTARSAE
jgi:aminoglycoside/choline kinase family phosphotransferase